MHSFLNSCTKFSKSTQVFHQRQVQKVILENPFTNYLGRQLGTRNLLFKQQKGLDVQKKPKILTVLLVSIPKGFNSCQTKYFYKIQKWTNNNTSLIRTCHCNAVLGTQRDFSVLMTVEGHAGEARHYHTPLFSSLFTFYKGPAVSIIGIFTIDKVSASGFI